MLPAFGSTAMPISPTVSPPIEEVVEEEVVAASEVTFQGSPAELPVDVREESTPAVMVARATRFSSRRDATGAVMPPTVSVQVAPAPADDVPAVPRTPPGRRGSFGPEELDEDALRQVMASTIATVAPMAGNVTPPEAVTPPATDA